MRTMDNRVLAVPFTEKGIIVSKTASGIPFIGNYDHLVRTTVLADGPDGIKIGDTIFVKGIGVKEAWAKVAYDLGTGTSGILVPKDSIVLVEPKE